MTSCENQHLYNEDFVKLRFLQGGGGGGGCSSLLEASGGVSLDIDGVAFSQLV